MTNIEVAMTLDECVGEVLTTLDGQSLRYQPELDTYRTVTTYLNQALRANAREREWSYYADTLELGTAIEGVQTLDIPGSLRPRIIGDDAVRLVNPDGETVIWAYFLPRDAIEKYPARRGLWVSITRTTLKFSRPFLNVEAGLKIVLPVMREPRMFNLPYQPEDDAGALIPVADAIRNQYLDFDNPDVVLRLAAYYYSMSDPVYQPRAQTLEQLWKDTYYQLNERDDRNTDSPYLNEWALPIQSDINGYGFQDMHHPHADDRS